MPGFRRRDCFSGRYEALPDSRLTVLIFPIALIVFLAWWFFRYYQNQRPRPGTLEWIYMRDKPPFLIPDKIHPMTRKDLLPILLITAVYAVVTFLYLGDTKAPQSFARFTPENPSTTIELKDPAVVDRIFYYTGLYHAGKEGYTLEFSMDGSNWVKQPDMSQEYSETFRWLDAGLDETNGLTRYIRISPPRQPMELGEIMIFVADENDASGRRELGIDELIWSDGLAARLFDEQHLVPERYDVTNSTHFDEIYHAYTAYQHVRGIYPYETTHPPLGKLITALGIRIFGMTPFGWRFMPALFGLLMLPILYIFIKNIFGKTLVAACGTILFASEFMHFTQTRISTIDVYGVFFILCMYFFMYRYMASGLDAPFRKTMLPLALCGLSFGLGVASKWISVYAAFGLIVLYVMYLAARKKYARLNEKPFAGFLVKTLAWSVLFFVVTTLNIYISSYIPYALTTYPKPIPDSVPVLFRSLLSIQISGNNGGITLYDLWDQFWNNQVNMLTYHGKSVLNDQHTFSARWYQWLIDQRPILYYYNSMGQVRGTLSCLANPLLCWGGLGALAACVVAFVRKNSFIALFVITGYLSQLLPWIPIQRITFPYHYFPSLIFLVLAFCVVFDRMLARNPQSRKYIYILTAASCLLFLMFYPVVSGYPAYNWYIDYFLKWLPSWTF